MATVYKFTGLTGGGAALDGKDGAGLLDGELAFAINSGVLHHYILDDDLGGAENSPWIITPDANAGNKRWVWQSSYQQHQVAATVGGTADAITLDFVPNIAAHATGVPLSFAARADNTAAATVAIDALGAIAVKRPDGTALRAGDIKSGEIHLVAYNGTDYNLLNPGTMGEDGYTTVASHATDAAIWATPAKIINYTGTATATAFPNAPTAGAVRHLICAAACSFTAGANMLVDGVASGNTLTVAAGSVVIVTAITTTQFKITLMVSEGEWTDYSATSTIVGFSSFVTKIIYTKKIGRTVFVSFEINGTSNATNLTFTLPYTSSNTVRSVNCAYTVDNGVGTTGGGLVKLLANTNTVSVAKDMSAAAWTNSGTKATEGQFWYTI